MKKISLWAKHHKWTSRILIVFILYPLLNITGWMLGEMFFLEGFLVPVNYGYILSLFFIALLFYYPTGFRNNYSRRKLFDFLLIATTFLFVFLSANNAGRLTPETSLASTAHASLISANSLDPSPGSSTIKKNEKKTLKKFIKNLRKKYKQASPATKGLLIFLTILVALGLAVGVASLSCSLACGGSEGLAYVVLFLGLGGIVFGAIAVIKRITKGKKKKNDE